MKGQVLAWTFRVFLSLAHLLHTESSFAQKFAHDVHSIERKLLKTDRVYGIPIMSHFLQYYYLCDIALSLTSACRPHFSHRCSLLITQCLKITELVSFNIASEASYVYILSEQRLIKNGTNGAFWRVFENLKLAVKQCYQLPL